MCSYGVPNLDTEMYTPEHADSFGGGCEVGLFCFVFTSRRQETFDGTDVNESSVMLILVVLEIHLLISSTITIRMIMDLKGFATSNYNAI